MRMNLKKEMKNEMEIITGEERENKTYLEFFLINSAAGMDNGEVAAIIVNTFNVLSTFIAVPAIEKLGRRVLLLGGFGVMGMYVCLPSA